MDKVPIENMEGILKAIREYGGNVPLAHDSYLGEARTLRTYPRGTRAMILNGVQELVVGADIEVQRWLNGSLEMYGIREEQTTEERERLFRDANRRGNAVVVRFYLTPDGKIHYTSGMLTSHIQVPRNQIPEAERLLRNVETVGYKDSGFITRLIGKDGSMVYSGIMLFGGIGNLRLLDEPQPDYSAEPINPEIPPTEDLYPAGVGQTAKRTPNIVKRLFKRPK